MGSSTLRYLATAAIHLFFSAGFSKADIVTILPRIKPAVVGVGSFHPLATPRIKFTGTAFGVADGQHVVTNAHALPPLLDGAKGETLSIFVREGEEVRARKAEKIAVDTEHDLALLKIEGPPLPALRIGQFSDVREGMTYYITGYPLGTYLGFRAATHRAGLAAVVPVYTPPGSAKSLNSKLIRQAQTPFLILQLDATAYPGNSGSPLFDGDSGDVLGVINSVFIKSTRENALQDPSGITYAIPANYIRSLLENAGLKP